MTILAISMDTPEDSRAFAADYGLPFPLLSDPEGVVSKVYAGVTSDHETLPGITLIRGDGTIAFRQVASAKDDRMTAAELIATIDHTLGTTGPTGAPGYAALDRAQLRLDLGGGAIDGRGTGVATAGGYLALGHHLLVGPRLAFEPRAAPLAADAIVMARLPLYAGAGALEVGVLGGFTPWGDARGPDAGATADLWFAMAPTWSLQLGATFEVHDAGGANIPTVFATFGVARLVRRD